MMFGKKSARRSYLDDYHRTASGEYIYTGAIYIFEAGEESRVKYKKTLWLLTAPMIVLAVIGGFLRVPGMVHMNGVPSVPYIMIPYTAELILAVLANWGMASMNGKTLREYTYKRTVLRLPKVYTIAMIAALIGLVGEIVFIAIFGTFGHTGLAVLYCVFKIISAGLNYFAQKVIKNSRWLRRAGSAIK